MAKKTKEKPAVDLNPLAELKERVAKLEAELAKIKGKK